MVLESDCLVWIFVEKGWFVLVFLDIYELGKLEVFYLLYCEKGMGEEEFVFEF